MQFNKNDTAPVVIDPQNDVLSEKGRPGKFLAVRKIFVPPPPVYGSRTAKQQSPPYSSQSQAGERLQPDGPASRARQS
jgi:hypothetical protein